MPRTREPPNPDETPEVPRTPIRCRVGERQGPGQANGLTRRLGGDTTSWTSTMSERVGHSDRMRTEGERTKKNTREWRE